MKFFNRKKNKEIELQIVEKKLENTKLLLEYQKQVVENLGVLTKIPRSLSKDLYSTAFQPSGGALNTGWWGFSNTTLRRASRILYWESPTARSIVNRFCDLVVGSGLNFQAAPIWTIINNTKYQTNKQRKAWKQKTENRFHNWAKSKNVDAVKRRNLYQLMHKLFFYFLRDGEFFIVLRYSPTFNRNPLSLQVIPPENIQGGEALKGNKIRNGIEYNAQDQAVAYHIYNENTAKTTRIPKYGPKSGRLFVIHAFDSENEKQGRGIPLMSRSMPECTKLADYFQIELQSTLLNAVIAVWVEPPEDEDGRATIPKSGVQPKTAVSSKGIPYESDWTSKLETMDMSSPGGVYIDQLPKGHKLHSYDTKRPADNFNSFVEAVKKQICASSGAAMSVVDFAFNESYSGARGELLIFYIGINRMRDFFVYDAPQPIYSMWFVGEVDNNKIDAPGYYNDPEIRDAWEESTWTGSQRPDIDPLKSVSAHILEQKYGYNTGQKITAERNSGDYDENLEVIKTEFESIVEALQDFYQMAGAPKK